MDLSDTANIAIITALLSGCTAALVNFSLAWWKSRSERIRGTKYLALRISFALEEYAYECADRVEDHKLAMDSGGAVGDILTGVLDLAELPKEAHVEYLNTKLLHRALEFPVRIKMANGETSFTAVVAADDEASKVAEIRTREIGQAALMLADKFRGRYNLPKRRLMFNEYDVRRILDVPFKRFSWYPF